MFNLKRISWQRSTLGALVGGSLLIAACGGSGSSSSAGTSSAAASAGSASTQAVASAPASGAAIKVAHGQHGSYLVGPSGRALYLWMADSSGKSSCSGACAQAWPPLTSKGKPAAGAGVKAADLGTTTRSDGSNQVTYRGHPLYYFAGDSSPGKTTGQGSNAFGAKWWLVSPSGAAITGGGSSGGYSSGPYSSSSGGGGY